MTIAKSSSRRRTPKLFCMLALAVAAALSLYPAVAQEQDLSAAEIAKLVQNPLSDAILVPLANDANFGVGPWRQPTDALQIQPVVPFHINDDWNLITRTTIPLISQARFSETQGRENGIGDIVPILALSPSHPGPLIWGFGPTFSLPTATDKTLGTRQWSAGPAAVALVMPDPWVFGALVTQHWGFAGSHEVNRISRFSAQLFAIYNFPDGTFLSSTPIINADFTADAPRKWIVPVGGEIGRVFEWEGQAMSASVGAYYNVVRPAFGPQWQLRLNLTLLFPK